MVAARVPRVLENNKLRYIVVRDGDTRERLEEEFQLLHWELPRYNELNSDFSIQQVRCFISSQKGKRPKQVMSSAMLWREIQCISYLSDFGIKLKSLCKMNRMQEDSVPGTGNQNLAERNKTCQLTGIV